MRPLLRHQNYYKKHLHFFSPSITMIGKNIIFDDKKVKKSYFTKTKKYLREMTLMLKKN